MSQQKRITKQKGITLISLVITIVILLILAGVAISINVGPDGLFSKAQQAKEDWNGEVANEEIEINNWLEHEEITGIKQTTDEDATTIAQKDDNTYLIQSIEDLVLLSKTVNSGTSYEGKTIEIEANLSFTSEKSYVDPTTVDFAGLGDINENGTNEELMVELTTGKGFIPIGNNNTFKGTIEGNNNTIEGLYINRNTDSGFIARAVNATINNLSLNNANVKGGYNTAGFIGYVTDGFIKCENLKFSGSIQGGSIGGILGTVYASGDVLCTDSKVEGTISGSSYGGGLVGQAKANNIVFKNCSNDADVAGSSYYAGGMCAYVNVAEDFTIENCNNVSDISGSGQDVGGLVGQLNVKDTTINLTSSSNSGNITGRAGLIAYLSGNSSYTPTLTIDKCYNTGNVTSKYDEAGGIVAEISSIKNVIIQNCYNTGSITLTVNNCDYIGGIVGSMSGNGKIYNCYNTGEFVNGWDRVGGIIGYYGGNSAENSIIVENCYNAASFTAHNWAGGIFGDDENGSGNSTIKNCYNEGDITADYVGGIAGDSVNTIINCYNTGDITGVKNGSGSIGGILGMGYSSADNPNIIENVYNAGVITVNGTGTSPYIGGIMGGREAENYKLKNAYNLGEIKNLGNISKSGALSGSKCLMSTDCYYLQGTYSVGIYNEDTPDNPDNSGEKSETDIKTLMNTNLVSLDEWEAGPDGYPVLSCFKTAE